MGGVVCSETSGTDAARPTVGDVVMIGRGFPGQRCLSNYGEVGLVIQDDHDERPYRVQFSSREETWDPIKKRTIGGIHWYRESEVEKVQGEVPFALKGSSPIRQISRNMRAAISPPRRIKADKESKSAAQGHLAGGVYCSVMCRILFWLPGTVGVLLSLQIATSYENSVCQVVTVGVPHLAHYGTKGFTQSDVCAGPRRLVAYANKGDGLCQSCDSVLDSA